MSFLHQPHTRLVRLGSDQRGAGDADFCSWVFNHAHFEVEFIEYSVFWSAHFSSVCCLNFYQLLDVLHNSLGHLAVILKWTCGAGGFLMPPVHLVSIQLSMYNISNGN